MSVLTEVSSGLDAWGSGRSHPHVSLLRPARGQPSFFDRGGQVENSSVVCTLSKVMTSQLPDSQDCLSTLRSY
jgi:hypothetical protein